MIEILFIDGPMEGKTRKHSYARRISRNTSWWPRRLLCRMQFKYLEWFAWPRGRYGHTLWTCRYKDAEILDRPIPERVRVPVLWQQAIHISAALADFNIILPEQPTFGEVVYVLDYWLLQYRQEVGE